MMNLIQNFPERARQYAYVIAREVDGVLWFYGADNDRDRANQVALEVGGIVFRQGD